MITAKAKSAIYHLNVAMSGLEKAHLHLLQARLGLPKTDHDSRAKVGGCEQALSLFETAVDEAVAAITTNNQSKTEEV